MQTMRDQIVARIARYGEGKAFSAKNSLDIATRTTIDVALASLTQSGRIRRVRRGLYDVPYVNPALGGPLSRDIHEAAQAIARRQRWKTLPDRAWAANLLGLSSPFQTRTTQGHLRTGEKAALIVQALRHLGKEAVGPTEIAKLRSDLSLAEKRKLEKDARFGADWIYELAKKIAETAA